MKLGFGPKYFLKCVLTGSVNNSILTKMDFGLNGPDHVTYELTKFYVIGGYNKIFHTMDLSVMQTFSVEHALAPLYCEPKKIALDIIIEARNGKLGIHKA